MSSHGPTQPADPDEPDSARRRAAGRPDASAPLDFAVDLTSHEMLRRAHVLDALGPDWDPVAVLRDEEAAYDLLYSGLGAEQQKVYDELVAAGVLPRRGSGHAPA
ncbi:DUF6400 family protein [Streptomyces brasiliensis]|uniref:Uncharacterized protein n=1 Tax=Streptomyces brasiliensis TaxID=1954 RepID=A0A917KVJ1_9ACTN|nr:DUF6400 family protein [Streptomyces brasiliensis]GGJ27989.1 hypothetical protein GCM10010121_044130 [Streptomyces brasiliensis]